MLNNRESKQNGDEPRIVAASRRFYRDRPVTFALVLIALSTLSLITGIWMLPAQPG